MGGVKSVCPARTSREIIKNEKKKKENIYPKKRNTYKNMKTNWASTRLNSSFPCRFLSLCIFVCLFKYYSSDK